MTPSAEHFEGSFLAIDFAQELRLLSEAQLRGPWQVPAELVRRGLASGARTVRVRLGRRRLLISDDGEPLPPDLVEHLAVALDRDSAGERRHAALVALENRGALPLVWCAALARSSFTLRSTGADHAVRVELRPGRPALMVDEDPTDHAGTEVIATGLRLDRRRARWWLSEACRWVSDRVTVDGSALSSGPPRAMIRWKTNDPLPVRLSIPPEGDAARLWLLRHGALSTRASLPGYPAFDAAVEMSAVLDGEPAGAALLEAVTPHLRRLADHAAWLLIELARGIRAKAPWAQHRTAALLLQAAKAGLRRQEILGLPFITVFDGEERSHASPLELAPNGDVAGDPGPRQALAPDEDPSAFVLGGAPVAVLSAEERALLGDLIGTRFAHPPARVHSAPLLTRLWSRLLRLGRTLGRWRPWPGRRAPLRPEELTEAERLFEAGVRSLGEGEHNGAAPEVLLGRGAGPVRRRGRQWLAPRRNRLVERSIQAVAGDPTLLYPALLALMGGDAMPPGAARRRWLEGGDCGAA